MSVRLPRDVSGHVFGEIDVGEVPKGHGERLLVG
jgi:hypothetical protein